MSRSRFSEATLLKAAELREAGVGPTEIAKRLGMSRGAVDHHCLRLGAYAPATERDLQRDLRRDHGPIAAGKIRRFTDEEDRQLLALERDGLNPSEIGRALCRRPHSITARLMILARREARLEELDTLTKRAAEEDA